jgi:hypothetical protein
MKITRWNEVELGALSEDSVRQRYSTSLYQVHLREVPEPSRIGGSAPRRILIGVQGRWVLEADGRQAVVGPGDVVELSSGEFAFQCAGPVRYLAVYELPPELVRN